tara:strand:+ start:994 stop:1692 length:699 start_codon:yes stop_codon:yes gene_type:complete
LWSKNIEKIAEENNGKVIPFFKWSFNDDFYSYTSRLISELRQQTELASPTIDVGLFADFNKKYQYPTPSKNDPRVSCTDIEKFKLQDILGKEQDVFGGVYTIQSREKLLNLLEESSFSMYHGSMSYHEYIQKSMECSFVINAPGVGEYTSRLFDQTAIGNLIILRKNSYDQGFSWKEYIPQVDFTSTGWKAEIENILKNRGLWIEKGKYYYDNYWSSEAIFRFFIEKIREEL